MKTPLAFLLFLVFLAAAPGLGHAEDEYVPSKNPAFVKGLLAANQNMLNRFEAKYKELTESSAGHPSEAVTQQLTQLRYKITALEEDKTRLAGMITEEKKAENFADSVASKLSVPASTPLPAPIPDKPIKDDAERIGLMHSNALDYVQQKKYAEALQIYNEIILLDPDDDQAYIIMGHIYMLTGQYEKAQSSFQNAAHIDPENMNEITPFYENMILQDPNDDTARACLGYAFMILGELPKAENAFVEALNLNPNNEEARKGLAILSQQKA